MRYLYRKHYTDISNSDFRNEFLDSCSILVLKPHPFNIRLKYETLNMKQCLSRLYFWLITFGRYRIYFLCHGSDIVHSSFVVPKCYKFPFLRSVDYEIGPCVTSSDYRRRGSYTYVLDYITSCYEFKDAEFYMIVNNTNKPSIKGIEKAGFEKCGTVRKTKFFNKYKLEN